MIAGLDHVSLPMQRTDATSVYVRDPDQNLLEFMIYGSGDHDAG